MQNENLENQSSRITRNPSRGNTNINQGRVNEKNAGNFHVNTDPEQQLDSQENSDADNGADTSEGRNADFSGSLKENESNKSGSGGAGPGYGNVKENQ